MIKDNIYNNIVARFNTELQTSNTKTPCVVFDIDGTDILIGKKYPVRIVDRVGGGDAFCGGMIYGLNRDDWSSREVLDFAVASSAVSHTFHGDFNLVSLKEVLSVAGGDTSGRVQR